MFINAVGIRRQNPLETQLHPLSQNQTRIAPTRSFLRGGSYDTSSQTKIPNPSPDLQLANLSTLLHSAYLHLTPRPHSPPKRSLISPAPAPPPPPRFRRRMHKLAPPGAHGRIMMAATGKALLKTQYDVKDTKNAKPHANDPLFNGARSQLPLATPPAPPPVVLCRPVASAQETQEDGGGGLDPAYRIVQMESASHSLSIACLSRVQNSIFGSGCVRKMISEMAFTSARSRYTPQSILEKNLQVDYHSAYPMGTKCYMDILRFEN